VARFRSEGCAVVILKRYSEAKKDGDRVFCLIKGSAISQSGASAGISVPHSGAQSEAIQDALTNAGVGSADIGYIEAHGTGTLLGDAIEGSALSSVYLKERPSKEPLILGCLKASMGNFEAVATLASLIKVVGVFKDEKVPAQLNFNKLNPNIPLEKSEFLIPKEPVNWCRSSKKRIAAIHCFSFQGTNGHLILEEPETSSKGSVSASQSSILVLSTKSERALLRLAEKYENFLRGRSSSDLQKICYTTAFGRSHLKYRLALVGKSCDEMSDLLRKWLSKTHSDGIYYGKTNDLSNFTSEDQKIHVVNVNLREKLAEIGQQYVQGEFSAWKELYPEQLEKVELPSYPFEESSYWL
jgi:acyl transferase domain-containing protein